MKNGVQGEGRADNTLGDIQVSTQNRSGKPPDPCDDRRQIRQIQGTRTMPPAWS